MKSNLIPATVTQTNPVCTAAIFSEENSNESGNDERVLLYAWSIARMEIDYYGYSLVLATVGNFILVVTPSILPRASSRFIRPFLSITLFARLESAYTNHLDYTAA